MLISCFFALKQCVQWTFFIKIIVGQISITPAAPNKIQKEYPSWALSVEENPRLWSWGCRTFFFSWSSNNAANRQADVITKRTEIGKKHTQVVKSSSQYLCQKECCINVSALFQDSWVGVIFSKFLPNAEYNPFSTSQLPINREQFMPFFQFIVFTTRSFSKPTLRFHGALYLVHFSIVWKILICFLWIGH